MSVNISASVAEAINYAAAHIGMQKIINSISFTQIETDQLVCRIYSVPEFIFEFKQMVEPNGGIAALNAPALRINDAFYRKELLEAQEGEIKIEVFHPDQPDVILGFLNTPVHIQPYLHWDGAKYPESMPGFMQPNDPLILQVIKRAGEYAAMDGNTMSGYQCRSIEGVKKQTEYIYRALQDMSLHYISAPPSFEIYGQKIRIPHQVLHDEAKQGTCLDLAVLFATCLEAVSLNAVMVVIPGHAFAGVWGEDQAFSTAMIKPQEIEAELWNQAVSGIIPVECTFVTDGKDVQFASAVATGTENIKKCQYLIDVCGARNENIVPVYTYTDKPICEEQTEEIDQFVRQEFSKEKKSKLELLRDQAMDITARSRLLNCSSDHCSIEFGVNTGEFLNGHYKDTDIMKLLSSSGNKKRTNTVLRELFSKSRQNIRESGKSNLFLTLNELRWKHEAGGKAYRAVMYLCPAEIYRNGRGDLQLRFDEDEVFFNPALKILLEQGYHLDSSQLKDYPEDNYGEQMKLLRFLIENQKGWSIKEDIAHLALYSIPNEAVWNGLNNASVLSHEIVEGILAGKMDWENELPQSMTENDVNDIYPFETDSSQNEIIRSAFERKAQVIVGPAGNGKTQTVVNIMLEAIRRGEKVLFVSEMAPAMEVAWSKLNEVFDGLFNLKILYGKDKPADIVRQIKRTLDYLETKKRPKDFNGAVEARTKYTEYLKDVEQYYALMSRKNKCGKSLEELIEMYEQYSDGMLNLNLDDDCSDIPLSEAEDQISILAKVMEECERAKGEYSEYVHYDNLDGAEEQKTLELAQTALEQYQRVWKAACELREVLGITEELSEKETLQQMILIAKQLKRCPVYYKSVSRLEEEPKEEDSSFVHDLSECLKMTTGFFPEFLKKRAREKCSDMLRNVYSPEQTRNILKDYELNPEEVLENLSKIRVFRDKEGRIVAGASDQNRERFSIYKKTVEDALRDEPEGIVRAVWVAIEEIVPGNGLEIVELARKTDDCYKRYAQTQKLAEEKIIRNTSEFNRRYPNLPKKVLFEEWIENRNVDTNRSRSLYDGIVVEMEKKGYAGLIHQIEAIKKDAVVTRADIMHGFYKAWAFHHINKIEEELSKRNCFSHIIFQDRIQRMIEKEDEIRKSIRSEILQVQIARVPNVEEGVSNNQEFGMLQALVRKKGMTIRTFFEQVPHMLQEICPCMIMDPLAAAEYIPAEFPQFDLVLIDEGSQMPVYNALIPLSKGKRCMIFGDEKQLQPSDDFKKRVEDEYDLSVGRESVLTAAYVTSMPRKMLRFHYRSENEDLIAFSNRHYYNGDIITFPSCDTENKGVSYEFVKDGVYDKKGNKANYLEAERVIQYIRNTYNALPEGTCETLGVITLNVHQRDLIQSMLLKEVAGNSSLGIKVDELVSIVNLESCQGKEWDYVVISPGFGKDMDGKFSTGFGALNREYGANRLNVMLTRARKKMHVITSIEPYMLTDAKSEGVQKFREFLGFARGDISFDSRIYDRESRTEGLVNNVAAALEAAGYEVHTNIGSSEFKVDIGVISKKDSHHYCMGILIDHFGDGRCSIHDREVNDPQILESKGWKIYQLRKLNWIQNSNREIKQILNAMEVL